MATNVLTQARDDAAQAAMYTVRTHLCANGTVNIGHLGYLHLNLTDWSSVCRNKV